MPKVRGLTGKQKVHYKSEILADKCNVMLYEKGIRKMQVAEYLGISRQAVSNQFKEKRITIEVLIAIVTLTGADGEKLKELLTVC